MQPPEWHGDGEWPAAVDGGRLREVRGDVEGRCGSSSGVEDTGVLDGSAASGSGRPRSCGVLASHGEGMGGVAADSDVGGPPAGGDAGEPVRVEGGLG